MGSRGLSKIEELRSVKGRIHATHTARAATRAWLQDRMMHHPGLCGPLRDLDTGLYASAHWIWERRGTAKAIGFPFSEETVTETVLLDLASALAHEVHIVPFTKPEEGKIGADWEWCLFDRLNNRYLRFLMQAKVLDNADRVYAHIDRYIGNSGVRQIDRLRDTSIARGVPALYAFYNHLDDPSRLPLGQCACSPCEDCWGASVAPLDAIRGALPDKSFDTLRMVSFPWRCLLCTASGAGPGGDPIDGALVALGRLAVLSRERFPNADRDGLPGPPEVPETEPPSYLWPVLTAAEATRGAVPGEGVRAKLAGDNPGLDGVVLVDVSGERRR